MYELKRYLTIHLFERERERENTEFKAENASI